MTTPNSNQLPFDIFRFTTGGEEEVEIIHVRDAFFHRVLQSLGFDEDTIPRVPTEITENTLGRDQPDRFYPTENKIYSLILGNEALALVLDRRDDFNYHEVTCWAREPSETTSRYIARLLEVQNSSM